jgi:DNA modification methylase
MSLVAQEEYEDFLLRKGSVDIEGKRITLLGSRVPRELQPPDFKTETTTLWSFPRRGNWATHKASYRGNWAPQIARNVIERYSQPGDRVLDQMCGGGTTLIECKLTGRDAVGMDVSTDALMLTMDRLNFSPRLTDPPLPSSTIEVYRGDARNLDAIRDESIDLIATHPPYANIISYSQKEAEVDGDLSKVRNIAEFAEEMRQVAEECYRVLKPDHYCAILIGDTRRQKHYVPISLRVLQSFLEAGFVLKEDVIKAQHNTQTESMWSRLSRKSNFLLIMHEHLFIFRKPAKGEKLGPLSESMKWW